MAIETITGEHWEIRVGDVMDGLASLTAALFHCCMNSPPYWGLRNYGVAATVWPEITYWPATNSPPIVIPAMTCCLGMEATPEEFIGHLIHVYRGVWRSLRDDGVLFVNIGDSYATGAGSARNPGSQVYGKQNGHVDADAFPKCQPNRMDFGILAGNKVGIPWRFALAMQADGWILRQDVIWSKPAPMPESVSGWRWSQCRKKITRGAIARHGVARGVVHVNESNVAERKDGATWELCQGCDKCRSSNGLILRRGSWRPTTSHEYIFQFSKTSSYFADGDGSKEAAVGGTPGNKTHKGKTAYEAGDEKHRTKMGLCNVGAVETRNQRSVWKISAEGYREAHFACYPTELVRRCLIAATSRGGCCSACGAQYAPVVESKRAATRPGTNSKVNQVSPHGDSPYHEHSGIICGNRDPQRHTTTTVVTGYMPTCACNAEKSRPLVLDCFGGSMTTGQVAINMGCDFIGLEGKPEYAQLGVKRLNTPWVPVSERKKTTKARRKKLRLQRELF